MPEKAAQVMTLTAVIWLKEENKVGQHPGFLSLGAGILFGNYSFSSVVTKNSHYIDYFFLLLENVSPSLLLSFCFLLFLGLFALRSFLLSKHTLLYYKGLHFAGCIQWEAERPEGGKTRVFLSLPLSGSIFGNSFLYLLHGSIPGEIPCSSRSYWVTLACRFQ